MTGMTHITYLFDPLCGWCYGASAVLEKLAAQPDLTMGLAPTGLFSGDGARPMNDDFAAYAWSNDQRICGLTGQPFSEDYRRKILGDRTRRFDSGPATLALTAVSLTARDMEREALKAIQKARYVEGRDVTDISVLTHILRTLDLRAAADRFAAPDGELVSAHRKRVEAARTDMHRFGADGVPALIAGVGKNRRIVRANALFGDIEVLIAGLKAA
jgi:putative protein-disulfide isomerase